MPKRKHSPTITIRVGETQLAAAERAAAEQTVSLSQWLRDLIAEATGVDEDLPQGFAAMPRKAVVAAAKKGGWAGAE